MNVSDIRKNSRLQKILKKLLNSKPKHQYHRHTHNHHWTNINRIAFFKNRTDNPKSRKIWMNSTLVRNDDINYLVHTAKKYNADTLEQQYMHRYTIIHKKNDWITVWTSGTCFLLNTSYNRSIMQSKTRIHFSNI